MRDGNWELHVKVDGVKQPEHLIDGRVCVEAIPSAKFSVQVKYYGSGMHQLELLLDGKPCTSRMAVDGTGTTSYANTQVTFEGWVKIQDGQKVMSEFVFEKSRAAEGGDDDGENAGCGMASAPADWTRGIITLRVHSGVRWVLPHDMPPADHIPDLSSSGTLSERVMVKGGHSASAGAGAKRFSTHMWRAGQSCVTKAPGDPLELELSMYYRDSFYLMVNGDPSKVADEAKAEDDAEYSHGVAKARANLRRAVDTQKQLRKKPRCDAVIDLTDD